MSDKALTILDPVTPADFKKRHNELITFVKLQLKENKNIADGASTGDYGIIPYTKKKSLLKAGAEKLLKLFGLSASYELIKEVEDWEKGFVYYRYKCTITHTASGTFIADAIRSANSKEKQILSQGKPVFESANNVMAKAQKRALVAATVQATMAADIFDADVSPDDTVAPNQPMKAADDPRRSRLMMRLWGVAKEHGWTDSWIHAAVKKKWQVESLTEISNDQIEELTDFIVTKYNPVSVNEKPQLRDQVPPEALEDMKASLNDPETGEVELEVIEEPTKYYCKGPKHAGQENIPEVAVGEFCSDMCRNDYYPEKQTRTKFEFTKKKDDGETSTVT